MKFEDDLHIRDWEDDEEPYRIHIEKDLDLVEYMEKGVWDEPDWE